MTAIVIVFEAADVREKNGDYAAVDTEVGTPDGAAHRRSRRPEV